MTGYLAKLKEETCGARPRETLVKRAFAPSGGMRRHPRRPSSPPLPPIPMLTQRQLDILMAISRGFTNSDIAKMLGITEITVRNHLTTIFAKTGASSRAEAVATAIRKHLLEP